MDLGLQYFEYCSAGAGHLCLAGVSFQWHRRAMVEYALGLWPAPWRMCYMYARESNVERYKRWGFEVVPGCLVRSCDEARMPDEAGIILMRKQMNQEEAVHGSQWRGVA